MLSRLATKIPSTQVQVHGEMYESNIQHTCRILSPKNPTDQEPHSHWIKTDGLKDILDILGHSAQVSGLLLVHGEPYETDCR